MKNSTLYKVLDLVEEIEKVDKMIEMHSSSESKLMSGQYVSQKLKLSSLLFKELLQSSGENPDVMYLVKLFIEKFYKTEIQEPKSLDDESSLKRIEEAFMS